MQLPLSSKKKKKL